MSRILIPLIFGLAGCALLVSLGVWQVQRLAWKEGVLAEIETRIASPPVSLPATVDPAGDTYLPVAVTGRFDQEPSSLRVLVSRKQVGAGYRVISPFEVEGRRILVDRGFIRVSEAIPAPPMGEVEITGNLHWPDDRLSSTPENDLEDNTWFARDIDQMAEVLQTEPILLITRQMSQPDGAVTPLPVDTTHIPNDHLQYAITWFALAAIWAIMTLYYIRRQRRPAPES